jgi:tetratricopeptide (TPR) repeat protein
MFARGRFTRSGRLVAPCLLALLLACGKAPMSVDDIRELQQKGRYAETVDALRGMVDANPDDLELNYLFGRALYNTGEGGLAVWPLQRAAESPEHAVEANLMLADVSLQTRENQEALNLLSKAIDRAPDNIPARMMRAWAYLRDQKYEETLADLDHVAELAPDNIETIVPRAMALIGLKRLDEADALLKSAESELEHTEGKARTTLASGMCAGDAALDFERHEVDKAEAGFDGCLEKYPTEPLLVSSSVQFFDALGKPERGTEILRKAFGLEPERFRSPLIARMQTLGDAAEVERLTVEWTEQRPSIQSWFALASLYTQREDYPAARRAFEQAIALAKGDPSPMLQFAYGDTLIQLSDYAAAQKVIDQMAGTLYSDLLRGRMLLAQGDPAGALEALDKGVRLWPNNAAARYFAAQAAEALGDFDRAISEYRESIRADVSHTQAALDLALLYEAMGKNLQAIDIIGRYVRAHTDDPEGFAATVRIANRVGRHDVAAEGLRRLALLPGQAGRAVAIEADIVAGSRGEEAAANLVERSALDLTDPANATALRAFVGYLGNLGRSDQALQRIDAALAAHPDSAVLYALRGDALRTAGRPAADVAAAFERAVELSASNAVALAGLARVREEAGASDEALALYDRASAADPKEDAYSMAAVRLLQARGDAVGAEKRLTDLLKRHPRNAEAATELAASLVRRREDLDRAVALATRAMRFQGGAKALDVFGLAQLELGAPDEAVKAFQNALKLDPSSVRTRYQLGVALGRTGDVDAARDALRQVLDSGASTEEAELARAELARLDKR